MPTNLSNTTQSLAAALKDVKRLKVTTKPDSAKYWAIDSMMSALAVRAGM